MPAPTTKADLKTQFDFIYDKAATAKNGNVQMFGIIGALLNILEDHLDEVEAKLDNIEATILANASTPVIVEHDPLNP